MLSRSIKDVEILCYIYDANTTIPKNFLFNFFEIITRRDVDALLAWGKFLMMIFTRDKVYSSKYLFLLHEGFLSTQRTRAIQVEKFGSNLIKWYTP